MGRKMKTVHGDGFGSSRDGRGAGRTSARTNIWQRIEDRDRGDRGDGRRDGGFHVDAGSGGGSSHSDEGGRSEEYGGAHAERDWRPAGAGAPPSSAWDHAVGKQSIPAKFDGTRGGGKVESEI